MPHYSNPLFSRQGSSEVEQGTHKPLVGSSILPPGTPSQTGEVPVRGCVNDCLEGDPLPPSLSALLSELKVLRSFGKACAVQRSSDACFFSFFTPHVDPVFGPYGLRTTGREQPLRPLSGGDFRPRQVPSFRLPVRVPAGGLFGHFGARANAFQRPNARRERSHTAKDFSAKKTGVEQDCRGHGPDRGDRSLP
jgi:hypothetical protein